MQFEQGQTFSGLGGREEITAVKKFINNPDELVSELLEGYVLAYPNKVRLVGNKLVARTVSKPKGKVGVMTLGGSGHEPGLSGFVGEGLLDISVPGEIFAAPSPKRCLEALGLADLGSGVVFLVLNHAGDVLTANLTMEMARKQGLNVEMVLIHDDIASGPREKPQQRRGLVGFLPVFKIAGASAEAGNSLEQVKSVAERMAANMRTLGVAVKAPTHPCTGEALFSLGDSEMAVGMGQHGEAGIAHVRLGSADETAEIMLDQLLTDLNARPGEEVLIILNGAGGTTLMELFIIFRRVRHILEDRKISIARSLVGEFITTQEQAGFQMLIARLDRELKELWDAPCDAPYLVVR